MRALVLLFLLATKGVAAFKSGLADQDIPFQMPPVRDDVIEHLRKEREQGRKLYLATAADQRVAEAIAAHVGLFHGVFGSEGGLNLKGSAKAARLVAAFPEGYSYIGDCSADILVWRSARSALLVDSKDRLAERVRREGIPVENSFKGDVGVGGWSSWIRAARLHQWSKNLLVLVPMMLALDSLTAASIFSTLLAAALLCLLASLTYILNDLADIDSDRRHWSRRLRPFAAGTLSVRHGLLASMLGIPLVLTAGLMLSGWVFLALLAYLVVTLAYSFGLKRVPLLDTFLIATLFTLRLVLGIAAGAVTASPWLLVFSLFFFFSLATAKRYTELLRTGEKGQANGKISGRGYHVEDKGAILVFGISSGLVAVSILVQFLMHEIAARSLYSAPQWMWGAAPPIFLWLCRVWLLAHRGEMTDDPVVFALRDRTSLALGAVVGIFFLLAILWR